MAEAKFNLNDILRYLSIGIIIFVLIVVNKSPSIIFRELHAIKDYGWLLTGVLAFTIGSLFYMLYRNLIYPILFTIQDKLRSKSNPNYRTYFKRRFKCTSTEAMLFWNFIRMDTSIPLTSFDRDSSGIHLLYMSSVLFFIYSFPLARGPEVHFLVFPISAFLLFLTAFIYDKRIETLQLLQVKNISSELLASRWEEFKK